MSRRIEIQLTSRTGDDQWTWRAAGAREPRGLVPSSLVPKGTEVGAVVKADIESSMDGIEVLSISAPSAPAPASTKGEVIEILGSGRQEAGVSWTLAPKAKRSRRDGEGRGGRGGGRRDGRDGRDGRGPRGDARGGSRDGRPGGQRAGGSREARPQGPPQSTEHRNALLATLDPAQLPIAEQLLRGGIPAVRQAIDTQSREARAAGQPPVAGEAILAMAEQLLPVTSLAAWKDRAAGALAAGKETRLRDLRAVVTASRSVSLDEDGRQMAKTLREALDGRVKALGDEWVARMTSALDEGRLIDALRTSARAPEPSTRCPSDVATRLAEAAGAALTPETDPREWMATLDAVCESPVRRTVKPVGIPPETDTEAAARNAAGLVPALAKLLGLRIPPPPPRRAVHRREDVRRPD
jgi:hypothetical protein